jgi:cobalt-zinc-cadmium efflux system outer membrane protein
MERKPLVSVWVWTVISWPAWAAAQDGVLTLDAALQRAHEHSVEVVAAASRVEEARARLRGARSLRDNPTLDTAVGRRSRTGAAADLDFALSQTIELGGRRGARVAAAEAGVARASASADETRLRALRDVALAFARGLAAAERIALARRAEQNASEVLRVAEGRHARGDVAALDLNLARGALARARSDVRAAEASDVLVRADLKALLAIEAEAPLVLSGDLRPRPAPELASLLGAAQARPALRMAEAELREAQGEIAEGKGMRWPDVTPSVRYERDDGTDVVWGGLTLSLPFWNRGQAARGVAEARAGRMRAEVEASRRTARLEVQSAYEAFRLRMAALDELEESAALLEDNEALARRSYEVGQIGLAELLLVRRETVEARLLYLERRLEAVESEVELTAKAGVLR